MSGILNMEGKTPSRVLREEAKKRKQRATEQEARQEIQRAKPGQRISPEV